MSATPQLIYEARGDAAWLLLDRPEKRNALSLSLLTELDRALDRALGDDSVRAVVLAGRGPAFCAGADLDTAAEIGEAGREGGSPFASLLQRLLASPKPVLAAVHGPAFGGGLGLVAAADIAIASRGVVLSFSEVRLGLIPAMISVVVLPKLGAHHASRLFLTGRRFDADEAREYGLVHRVVDPERLEAAVAEEVADISKGGPEAIAEAKRLIRDVSRLDPEAAFAHTARRLADRMASAEAREGIAAFAEKRWPNWRRR